MFFRIIFTFLFALIVGLFITTKTAGAENLTEYCERTMDPACVGGTAVNDSVWSRMLHSSQFMYEILSEDRTEEGEWFRPVEPVLVHQEEDGTEYWDNCALSRKNLLLTYYGIPFKRLAIAVIETPEKSTRTVLLFHSPQSRVEVIDCEKDDVLSFEQFQNDGNVLLAAENTVSTKWPIGVSNTANDK